MPPPSRIPSLAVARDTSPTVKMSPKMCWTFQKSSANRVVQGCRGSMPGTSCRSRVQDVLDLEDDRASPKRSDACLAEATAVTGASVFRRLEMMARNIAGGARGTTRLNSPPAGAVTSVNPVPAARLPSSSFARAWTTLAGMSPVSAARLPDKPGPPH